VAHNRLKSLPKLPDGLIYLDISTNKFNKLPEYLPESLEKLYTTGNNIIELPEKFHNNIKEINLGYCGSFPTFPNFPDNITIINLERCYLTELPEFGQKLTFIEVSFNNLTTLGELPPNLKELYACNNKLVSMSYIPDSVTICCIDDKYLSTASDDGSVNIWSLKDRERIVQFEVKSVSATCQTLLLFENNKNLQKLVKYIKTASNKTPFILVGYSDGSVRIFDIDRKCIVSKLKPLADAITSINYCKNSKLNSKYVFTKNN
jgi:hypothetical protein